jgi:hypothetical protein
MPERLKPQPKHLNLIQNAFDEEQEIPFWLKHR